MQNNFFDIKLSVVVPYHNNNDGLKRLLESIGSTKNVEIIVVNDHSDKPGCLDDFSEINLQYHELPVGKRWAGASRNLGIELASGEYVTFADCDDYFTKNIDTIINELKGFDVYFYPPTSVVEGTSDLSYRHLRYVEVLDRYKSTKDKEELFRFYVPWSKIYRLAYIKKFKISFDEIIASNDVNFSLKSIFHTNSYKLSDVCFYCVVESGDSLTKQFDEVRLDARFKAHCDFNEFLISNGSSCRSSMLLHLLGARRFSFFKSMYMFFFCLYRKYPVFYSAKDTYCFFIRKIKVLNVKANF